MKEETLEQIQKQKEFLIRECYEKLYVNKLNNTDQINKFIERHEPLNVTQEEKIQLKF